MKYLFKKETIFATLSVFLVMGLFVFIPLNLHPLDPLKLALTDINFNDLSFSKLKSHKANGIDDRIIIVNIGEGGRQDITKLLNKINGYQTKAIGLDVLFQTAKQPDIDLELSNAIQHTPNIVLSDRLEWEGSSQLYHHNYFQSFSKQSGFVNFVGEDQSVVRYFSPFETWKDTVNTSFSSAIVKLSDEEKYNNLIKRNNELELINYRRQQDQFFIIEDSDIFNNKVDAAVFKNKIVLIGYINNNPSNIEDKHFTPLNDKFIGKTLPDMNGVIIQANIITMILDGSYINRTAGCINYLLAIILTWLFMAIYVKYYIEKHLWFHIVTKVIQLVLAFLFVYLGIVIMYSLRLSVDFTVTLVAIVLSVDVLNFYEAFALWLHKKYAVKTIFHKSGHK